MVSRETEAPAQERMLVDLSVRYCWDSDPAAAPAAADRVIRRVMDVGTWDDLLDLDRIFGRLRLADVPRSAPAGALTPRSWTFWHYRLGLADADTPPPARPRRIVG